MKKLKQLLISSAILTSLPAMAGGLTASGKISLLSHEVSGSYVQILDATNAIINSDPDSCGGADMYYLPLEHANYSVLSSSLLTAETTQRELAFHVEGCENGMAKIAFVRFGNWAGITLNTPSDVTVTPPADIGAGRKVFKATGVTSLTTNFSVPEGVDVVYVTMCGGGGAGGGGVSGGGGGATTILKKPYLVSSNEVIPVIAGGGAEATFECGYKAACEPGKQSSFGSMVAPGAVSGGQPYFQQGKTGESVLPKGFSQNSQYISIGGKGGYSNISSGGQYNGEDSSGNSGGVGREHCGGGGASFFGQGGNGGFGVDGQSAQGYCSGGGGASWSQTLGGNGAPGIVIVEW